MKNNFIQRTVTGVVFVATLLGCILYSPISFGIIFTLISALTIREFVQLLNNKTADAEANTTISMLGGAFLFLAIMAFCMNIADSKVFIPYLAIIIYLIVSQLYLKKENPIINWAYTMFSQIYVALPFALLNVLAFQSDKQTGSIEYNPILPLSIFVFIWLNDTGAYCIGTLIGKHRLFERISPKKSWEGSIGGGIITMAGSLIFAHYFSFIPILAWIGLAITVVVFGTWGDLSESLLKRQLGVKDSGSLLPGHGGMLDRFDSALIAIPAAVVYLYVILTLC